MDELLFRRRNLITNSIFNKGEKLIYSLENYTCDGTINTFIDTGIRLFTGLYESFRIELEYDNFDLENQINLETILECKSFNLVNRQGAGFTIRAADDSVGTGEYLHKLQVNFPYGLGSTYYENASSAQILLYYDGINNNLIVNDIITPFSGEVYHSNTLTIGGRYGSINNADRFATCHIVSLKIYVTLKSSNNILFKLQNYQCNGTSATAINTGLYLFDTNTYPNGWEIDFDFTISSGNVSQASYIRCRNATSPYNGFCARRMGSSANDLQLQLDSFSQVLSGRGNTRHVIHITSDLINCTMVGDGVEVKQALSSVISPLVIGGELSDDTTQTWNASRYCKIYIHSLIVRKL